MPPSVALTEGDFLYSESVQKVIGSPADDIGDKIICNRVHEKERISFCEVL